MDFDKGQEEYVRKFIDMMLARTELAIYFVKKCVQFLEFQSDCFFYFIL